MIALQFLSLRCASQCACREELFVALVEGGQRELTGTLEIFRAEAV
jgi:hypothetical protein